MSGLDSNRALPIAPLHIMASGRTVKVAVIGTGLAGLTAAYLLAKACEGDQVNFEAPTVGMDSASISLASYDSSSEDEWRVDVPMRSFQGGYYKNMIALYQSIGVKFRQADFSYSFSSLRFSSKLGRRDRKITTTMIYNGSSGRAGVSKPAALGNADKQDEWASQATPQSTLSSWLGLDAAWTDYIHSTLIPLLSAVCTAPAEDIMNHPMEEFLDYVWLTFGTHHYVVVDGVRDVVSRLTTGVQNLHLSSTIISMQADENDARCVSISCLVNGQTKDYSGFHHIVLATQASGAVPILSKYLQSLPAHSIQRATVEKQIDCLKAFDYRKAIVINHTDGSLLPDNSKDARDLNLISLSYDPSTQSYQNQKSKTLDDLCVAPSYTMATHILPMPKGYPHNAPRVFQTTNPIVAPDKESLLSVSKLERAIVTNKSKSALGLLCVQDSKKWWQCSYQGKTRLGELQGNSMISKESNPGIWICGSYAHLGIPLLEGCVVSARNVGEGILRKEGTIWKEEPWRS
ncbi:hypothetical protein CVT25_005965 [Psilocybe cyanescens]|uniref:Amine oxidase domain-containing protein n=1 Tax=Psilocybe cyanescens TaxID=93625 RepID=A0A409VME1_PSICY|nr:hypothetical protein CVT25_005965 [Psilocybe cyanescens]